jgi:cellulose synthase/poly-beta-1,6-N-acetylglucosamine synthase-like glycosyltransferase
VLREHLRRQARVSYQRLLEKAHEPRPARAPAVRRQPLIVSLDGATTASYIQRSVVQLAQDTPEYSAHRTVTLGQRRTLIVAAALFATCLVVLPRLTLVVVVTSATVIYTAILGYRISLFRRSLRSTAMITVSDERARAVPDDELPVYTVLIPAYREPEVIKRLIDDVVRLEYPPSKLDVKLLIEADDPETLAAVHAAAPPAFINVVVVPSQGPRTKPKAVNFGLCLARGEIVTIFDAEDRPEPLQLRRSAVAFAEAPDDVVCLQAALTYYNGSQNIITKWFQGEYLNWFRYFLPGLAESGVPIPLGGTSNHMRRSALDEVGGWDPYNVTEDADLGIRLHRLGYRCGVLDSVTYEEATSDFVNWAKQRSRWQKGYLQTWLVHMRHPRQLWRELGPRGFLSFNLFVGGTPLLALINPIFWTLTVVWFLTSSHFIASLFPGPLYYVALLCWVLGNAAVVYMSLLSVTLARQPSLALSALLSPAYWLMMSVSAYKAFWQIFREPSLWEKTAHGMDRKPPVLAEADDVAA